MCSLESVLYPKLKKKKLYLSYQYVYLYCLETSVWPWCWSHLALPRLSPYGVNIHNFHSPCIKLGSYFSVKHSSLIILCNPLSTHSLLLSLCIVGTFPQAETHKWLISKYGIWSRLLYDQNVFSAFFPTSKGGGWGMSSWVSMKDKETEAMRSRASVSMSSSGISTLHSSRTVIWCHRLWEKMAEFNPLREWLAE